MIPVITLSTAAGISAPPGEPVMSFNYCFHQRYNWCHGAHGPFAWLKFIAYACRSIYDLQGFHIDKQNYSFDCLEEFQYQEWLP